MNETENNPGAPTPYPEANFQELQRLVNILFGALILSSFTLTVFLGLQMKRAHQEAANTKVQAEQLMQTVQQEDAGIQAAYAKLSEFARKHPDFQNRILSKYKFTT